jgi:hypothetical protein
MPFISLRDFIKEHKKLIPTLTTGSKKQRTKEAISQMKELKKVIKRGV